MQAAAALRVGGGPERWLSMVHQLSQTPACRGTGLFAMRDIKILVGVLGGRAVEAAGKKENAPRVAGIRMRREEASPERERAFDAVKALPGASVQEVAAALDVDHSTAEYHLHRLLREGRVRAVRAGRVRAHYASGTPLCPFLREVTPKFRSEGDRRALAAMAAGGTWRATDLPAAGGLSLPEARWFLQKAAEEGLLQREGHGRWSVAPACAPCVAHLTGGTACGEWGACAVSRSPRFSDADGARGTPPHPWRGRAG